ncbi:MAG: glycosyltransferase family 4 protein [Carboxylicivirga sp.]|jgi:glycosyltransferase involved in cell wall biosynthesis|nr:glycosyltransferase family 4 protein [Carboxylicivirga sp.]
MPAARSKTICFVIPNYVTHTTGGAELQIYYLTKEFIKRDWQVELIYGAENGQGAVEKSPYFDEKIQYIPYRKFKFRAFEFFSVLASLLKSKAGYYYQRTDFALTAACALYCRINKRHMTYALAQDQDAYRGKYIRAFKSFVYQSNIKRRIRQLDFHLIDKMVEYGKTAADLIVCQNNDQQMLLKANFNREAVIVPSIAKAPEPLSVNKENIVLWVGNMYPVKRPQLFIELANRFKKLNNWRFVMIGRISDEIVTSSKSKVEILGECSYNETANWFARAKVFVNTSEQEGMPNTFLQAWYHKVLVLSLNVNPDEVFKNDQYGFVFNDAFIQLGDHLNHIIEQGDLYDEVLEQSFNHVQQKHHPEKVVSHLLEHML